GTTQLGEWRGRAVGEDDLDGRYGLSSAVPPFAPSGLAHEPTVLVLGPSVLDVEQRLAQLHGLLSGFLTVIDGEVLGHELADRRDHRGRAAGEGLDDLTPGRTLAPFLDGDPALLGFESELRRELEQRTTGDAVEDRIAESRREQLAALRHEHEVHAAELVDVLVLLSVSEQHLLAPLGRGLIRRHQRGCVVAAALGEPGAAGASALELRRQPDAQRLDAAGEVRS